MKRVFVLGAVVAAVVLAVAGGSARGAASACPTSNHPNELVLAVQLALGDGRTVSLRGRRALCASPRSIPRLAASRFLPDQRS